MKKTEISQFAENLKEARNNAGLSQKNLAERAGVSVQMISQWERSEKGISADSLARLSNALGVSMDSLWNGEELEVRDSSPSKRKIVFAIAALLQSYILTRVDYPSAPIEYEVREGLANLIRDIESAIRNSGQDQAALKKQLETIAKNTPYL